MSEIVGSTAILHATTTKFSVTHVLSGTSGHGHFKLHTASGLSQLISNRASAKLLAETLAVQLASGVTAEKSYQVAVGFMPDNTDILPVSEYPVTAAGILRYSGSVVLQRSELANPLLQAGFPDGVSTQLKPAQLVEFPPVVVYHFTSEGTQATDRAILRISGRVETTGFGFVKLHVAGE